jgi:hypothetical protein
VVVGEDITTVKSGTEVDVMMLERRYL